MIVTPSTRLQDHPEALTLLKLLRHFGYSSAQIMQALAHLDVDRPVGKAEDETFFALLNSRHIDYAVSENCAVVVHGDLDLEDTGITTLPDNLSVGGYLYLGGTGITTLPDNLSVGGHLYLRDTSITVIPGSVHVVGNILTGASRAGIDGGAA